jgi:hypothetical protein
MERKQHHTAARPRWILTCFRVRIESDCRLDKGRREVETLWRILLQRAERRLSGRCR